MVTFYFDTPQRCTSFTMETLPRKGEFIKFRGDTYVVEKIEYDVSDHGEHIQIIVSGSISAICS